MSVALSNSLRPRRKPRQLRSSETVSIICQAGLQVLLAGGYARFTTTRVADRAGVSIGTLYQYFPNKRALLAALVESHLEAVAAAVEAAARDAGGLPLAVMTERVVDAVLDAKLERPDVSLALYRPSAEAEGATLVRAAGARAAAAIGAMLRTCPDAAIPAPEAAAGLLAAALAAVMQAALEDGSALADRERLRRHMVCLGLGYLRALGAG